MVDQLRASGEHSLLLEAQLDPSLRKVLRSFVEEKGGRLQPPSENQLFSMLFWEEDSGTQVAVSVQIRPRFETDILSLAATIRNADETLVAENKSIKPAPKTAEEYRPCIEGFVATVRKQNSVII